ncbi:PAS domain S-box protein [Deinococcus sp. QL22]|uniref:PAS domain S-box protein n=1 Tax=Deinococcus sp. QL22 TaxID=2939437 RepID=UPI002017169B|nr:PAS domain S-box protein [Deinococcus sp. QL22]UQN10173.1 PAS domain S-box protein [Deinococcus sp. QL22]
MTSSNAAASTALFDALPDPGLLVDPEHEWRVQGANPAAQRVFGVQVGTLLSQALPDFWSELARHTAELTALPAGKLKSLQLHGTGDWRWVEVRAFRVGALVALQVVNLTAQHADEARNSALFALTVALSKALTNQEAAEIVLQQGRTALNAATGSVFVLDPVVDELVLAGMVGYEEADMQGWQRVPVSASTLLGDALQAGKALFLSTAEVEVRYPHLNVRRTLQTRATVALPLMFGGQPLGVVTFGFAGEHDFGSAERRFLLALSQQLAQALERARLFAQERQAHQTATLLYELTAALGRATTPGEVAQVIAQTSVPVLEATGGAVLQLDAAHEDLVLLGVHGYAEDRPVGWERFSLHLDVIGADCARTQEAIFLGTPEYLERYPHRRGHTLTEAAAALPLWARGRLLGVLSYDWDEPHQFSPAERELLLALAGQCAQALERTVRAEAQRTQVQLLNLAQDALFVRNATNEVTHWNPAAEALYGYSAQEARGRVTHELLQTRFPVSQEAVDEALLGSGRWEGELQHRARDGREVVVSSRQSLRRDEDGKPVAILEVNRDVTVQQAAQNALLTSQHRYQALIEATDQYVWTNSPKGEMAGEQPGWARLTGQSQAEYQGYGWSVRLHPEDREYAVSAWQESVRTRSLYEVEQRVQVQDGAYRSFLVRAVPLLNEEGGLREWVGLHTDITDLKRAEQLLQAWGSELERQIAAQTRELRAANEELGAFAYTVSHDLRAPVRHVKSFAGLLRKKVQAGDEFSVLRYVDVIEQAAERMETLTDALLSLARAGMTELETTDIDLNFLVDEIRSDLIPELAGREVTWQVGALPTVRVDLGLFRQVLTNLLENAIKYSRGRDPAVVEVWAEQSLSEIVVMVRDNGAGFDPQYAGKLFGVFQRLHHQSEFEGTGVGLANVKRIVEKHGGRVWAEGRPGEGATFFLSLPQG